MGGRVGLLGEREASLCKKGWLGGGAGWGDG